MHFSVQREKRCTKLNEAQQFEEEEKNCAQDIIMVTIQSVSVTTTIFRFLKSTMPKNVFC